MPAPDADAGPGAASEAARERAIQRALDGCARHWFVPIRLGCEGANRSRGRCAYCNGEADGKAVRWYNIGVRHGREEAERAQCGEAAAA